MLEDAGEQTCWKSQENKHAGRRRRTNMLEDAGEQTCWKTQENKHAGRRRRTNMLEDAGEQTCWKTQENKHAGRRRRTNMLEDAGEQTCWKTQENKHAGRRRRTNIINSRRGGRLSNHTKLTTSDLDFRAERGLPAAGVRARAVAGRARGTEWCCAEAGLRLARFLFSLSRRVAAGEDLGRPEWV